LRHDVVINVFLVQFLKTRYDSFHRPHVVDGVRKQRELREAEGWLCMRNGVQNKENKTEKNYCENKIKFKGNSD